MAGHAGRAQQSRLPAVHRRLEQPRPPLERSLNHYVETPLPKRPPPPPPQPKPTFTLHKPCREVNFAMVSLPVTTQPPRLSTGILCTDCGRCRCTACRTPKPLPSGFLCGTTCLCSPEACVDYATCMFLPKACSYHCGVEEENARPGWLCLAASTLLCPCLLCYLPCAGCLRLCEACQRLCTTPGCRCSRVYPPPMEKRLLDSPE